MVKIQKKYANGKQIQNAFQTNGVLLDDEWAALFKESNFLIGLSIDGPHHLHEAHRVDKGGQPTFDRVMRGMETLKRNDIEFNTLSWRLRTPPESRDNCSAALPIRCEYLDILNLAAQLRFSGEPSK